MASFTNDDVTKAINAALPAGATVEQLGGLFAGLFVWGGALAQSGLTDPALLNPTVTRMVRTNERLALEGERAREIATANTDAGVHQAKVEALTKAINDKQKEIDAL